MSQQRRIQTGNNERRTPRALVEWARNAFGPSVDVASTPENAVCPLRCRDGLAESWAGLCRDHGVRPCVWMNPPYGRWQLEVWCRKAAAEADLGVTTIALLPADTSAGWFHRYCANRPMLWIRGRLKFDDCGQAAPFASVIVLFLPGGVA